MASLSFSYRSKLPKAFLEVRLSYRVEGENLNPKTGKENPISFYSRSKIEVEKSYWKNEHSKKSNDAITQKLQNGFNGEMTDLRIYVLDRFDKTDIENINKEWFEKVLHEYYNPKTDEPIEVIPTLLTDYFDYYLECRENDITPSSERHYKSAKKKILNLEKSEGRAYEVKDVNDNFKNKFVNFHKKEKYSQNTIQRAIVFIKTVCIHAKRKGVETSAELEGVSYKKDDDVPKVWLTFDDLENIEKTELEHDYLDNARDWLIISCYTGQRVSDLLRFTSGMITEINGNKLLEFRQQKTKKLMAIALHHKVLEILEKRNGEFPRSISDQRYNEYIKEVCKKAELNEPTRGRLKVNIAPEGKPKKMRLKDETFEKWELVSSHIGRRSYATNFYSTIPLPLLMNATGHKTETMLLEYLGKSKKDLAMETFKYFK